MATIRIQRMDENGDIVIVSQFNSNTGSEPVCGQVKLEAGNASVPSNTKVGDIITMERISGDPSYEVNAMAGDGIITIVSSSSDDDGEIYWIANS